jgi:hypothetical protein
MRIVSEGIAVQPVPQDRIALVQTIAPPEAEIVPLTWVFEDEDYNITVVMPGTVDRPTTRQIEDRLIDAVIDWDAAHHTFTLCKVWRQHEMARAGVL